MPEALDWSLAAALLFGYLCGSIPFGWLFTRLAGLGDIREIGSGNIGATNVLRTGSRFLAGATLAADLLKGTLAVVAAAYALGTVPAMAAGLGACLGHIFPVWLKFRGGKGVATYIGVLAGLHWPAALAFIAIWLVTAAITRISSLSALVASLASPFVLFAMGRWALALLFAVLTMLLWAKHHENIRRLREGREPRIGAPA